MCVVVSTAQAQLRGFIQSSPVRIRSSQYLNNIVEQDHRQIKFGLQPMPGFKSFYSARRVIAGIELMQMIHEGQFRTPHYGES